MSQEEEISRLRLASARRRLNAFLEQVTTLLASSFPHGDAEKALLMIKEFAEEQRELLNLDQSFDAEVIDGACRQVAKVIDDHTWALGFLLRSTNVRNAFEVYNPLRRLAADVLGVQAKLVISAEWNFVPFTHAASVNALPDFILIGTPAPEAGNALVAPLAGHEIGHSLWQRGHQAKKVKALALPMVRTALDAQPDVKRQLLSRTGLEELGRGLIEEQCADLVVRQMEEIFSDLFGLRAFGAAYLFAFDYFMAPQGYDRVLDYPSERQRVAFMRDAATMVGIEIEENIFERWGEGEPLPPEHRPMAALIDPIVQRMTATIRDELYESLEHLPRPDADRIRKAKDAFAVQVPFAGGATLSEAVIAGWQILRDRGGLSEDDNRNEYNVLNHLIYKTVEVSDFLGANNA